MKVIGLVVLVGVEGFGPFESLRARISLRARRSLRARWALGGLVVGWVSGQHLFWDWGWELLSECVVEGELEGFVGEDFYWDPIGWVAGGGGVLAVTFEVGPLFVEAVCDFGDFDVFEFDAEFDAVSAAALGEGGCLVDAVEDQRIWAMVGAHGGGMDAPADFAIGAEVDVAEQVGDVGEPDFLNEEVVPSHAFSQSGNELVVGIRCEDFLLSRPKAGVDGAGELGDSAECLGVFA